MNEEEKKAYDYLEKYIEWETLGERNLEGDIKTILDVIKNQHKEIENLKEKLKFERNFSSSALEALKESVSKDKIREFMKDYQEGDMVEITGVCKFLLGE